MANPYLTTRLSALREAGGVDPAHVERLGRYLEEEPEREVFRMNPYRYAERTGTPARAAIDLFVRATHAGVLEFTWGVLCKGCGGFLTTASALRALEAGRDCRLCGDPINASVDDNVEVAFTVAPAARSIRYHRPELLDPDRDWGELYYSGSLSGDANAREHIDSYRLRAFRLAPGESFEHAWRVTPGWYQVVCPITHGSGWIEVREHYEGHRAEFSILDGPIVPDQMRLAPGDAALRVTNRLSTHAIASLLKTSGEGAPRHERLRVLFQRYLTGKELVTMQAFRDLFRAEALPSEAGLEFKNVSVLFTDLKDSTALYSQVGDVRAFALVRRHFVVLREAVAARGGAVVKTIGDAVMAVFPEAAPAFDAAVAMHRAVRGVGNAAILKVGLHSGPCIAVEQNDRLDYFGQTVNVAARVQHVAGADEIVVTGSTTTAEVEQIAREAGLGCTREAVELKGIDGAVPVLRFGAPEGGWAP